MSVEMIVHPDADSLAAAVVLTGGGMGGQSRQAVVASPAARAVDWKKVDFYWGDEGSCPKIIPSGTKPRLARSCSLRYQSPRRGPHRHPRSGSAGNQADAGFDRLRCGIPTPARLI